MKNNNSVNLETYSNSYIVAGVLFGIIFALCMTLFNFVTYAASGIISNVMNIVSVVAAFMVAVITAVRCARASKSKYPDAFTPPRDTAFYFKRIAFITIMIIIMSLAASLLGAIVVGVFWGGIVSKTGNAFFSEFLLKLPVFIIYITFVYKMLVRFGFMDSRKKIFNPNFIFIKLLYILTVFLCIFVIITAENTRHRRKLVRYARRAREGPLRLRAHPKMFKRGQGIFQRTDQPL